MQPTPSELSKSNISDEIVEHLRNGILLEDTGVFLAWWSDWESLKRVGEPQISNEQDAYPVMAWNNRKCLGGLKCSLLWQRGLFSENRLFTRARILLPTHEAQNRFEAAEEFHESVNLLESIFGRPDRLQYSTALPDVSLNGDAEWHYPEFSITHTLTTPWDGFSNATFISVQRRPLVSRLLLRLKRYRDS